MKPSLVLWVIVLCAGCSNSGVEAGSDAANKAEPSVAVDAATVETRELERTVEAVGTLDPNEEVTVSSQVDAPVAKVLVDLGDPVRAGQVLVALEVRELELNVELQAAALQQELSRLGLKDDKSEVSDSATTQVRQADASFRDAELRLDRVQKLAAKGVMAQETLDEAKARYDAAQAALQAAQETVRNIRAAISSRRASLDLARKRLADARITAPIAGFVKERLVSEGQLVRVNTAVVTIVQNNLLKLRVEVPESAVQSVKVGQSVAFTVDGFPGQSFEGRVSRLAPALDRQTRTLKIEALVDNGEGKLKPGFFARARIRTDQVDAVPMVPAGAVVTVAGIEKVLVIENGKIAERLVRTGTRMDGGVEIVEGLKAGERVATSNLGNLQQGLEVTVR